MFMMGFFLCSFWICFYAASLESVCASNLSNINTHAYSQGLGFNWELLLSFFHLDRFCVLFQCGVFIPTLIQFHWMEIVLKLEPAPKLFNPIPDKDYLYCGRFWSHSNCAFIIPTEFGLLISQTKFHFNNLESVLQVFLLLVSLLNSSSARGERAYSHYGWLLSSSMSFHLLELTLREMSWRFHNA